MSLPDLHEYNVQADGLIEAIRQYYRRTDGVDVSDSQLVKDVTEIIKRRIAQ